MIKVDLTPMQCDRCRNDAIVQQPYAGSRLCREHFIQDFSARAKREIRRGHMIQPGDRIAVGLSGGKDSSALLHFLSNLLCNRRDISLVAITIDEGITPYRDPACGEKIARDLGIDWVCARFQEMYGTTIDALVQRRGDRLSCSWCGVLRRHCLNRTAKDMGATKLALGFNLDDEAQSVLMNVLRGDLDRLVRNPISRKGFIPRIKPFRTIPEREVALYAFLTIIGYESGRCPYAATALRSEVRDLLNAYTLGHPSTKHALMNLGERLAGMGTGTDEAIRTCARCGEPSGDTCRSCQIIDEVSDRA
ncbi:MAG: TIGR00269 family protein [Methanomicrobiales archaeon]|nr:TIGR00269 family protein [Methanomicrobiales archaeon]